MTTKHLLLLLALLVVGCRSAEAQPRPTDPEPEESTPDAKATRVETAQLRPSTTGLQLMLPGEVEGSRDASLASPMGGYIERVLVSPGDHVRRGQTLVSVDTSTHAARRDQARVEHEAAQREHRRAKKLKDALPGAELDAADTRLKAAKAAVRTADVMVARSIIAAPFAGLVVSVDAEVGEVAAPGVPLVRLVTLHPAQVTISLSERDVGVVREGMAASITTPARAGLVLQGTVKHVHRAADLDTRTFIAEVEVANENESLLPGMIASVRLAASLDDAELVIRQDWLVTKGDGMGVYIDDDGKAVWREVELGPITRDQVVVRRGLQPGDSVVVTGHRQLADGDPLLIARQGTCCVNGRVTFD